MENEWFHLFPGTWPPNVCRDSCLLSNDKYENQVHVWHRLGIPRQEESSSWTSHCLLLCPLEAKGCGAVLALGKGRQQKQAEGRFPYT